MNIKCYFIIYLLFFSILILSNVNVGFGGVYTITDKLNLYNDNKLIVNQIVRDELYKMQLSKELSFNLIFETDSEARKYEIDNSITMAIIINRDDVESEKFKVTNLELYKNIINIGLSIVFYKSYEDYNGKNKNIIISTIPIAGYSFSLENKALSLNEINKIFCKTTKELFSDNVFRKLKKINLEIISGKIKKINKNNVELDIGRKNGLVDNQFIKFYENNEEKFKGKIIDLKINSALVEYDNFIPTKNLIARTYNIKYSSNETYQVVGFNITSNKAKEYFSEDYFGPIVSQWFSDTLSNELGKAVYPSKISGNWITDATNNSFQILLKDGTEYLFEVPTPDNEIYLVISGVTSKIISKNNINHIKLFKGWLEVENKSKNKKIEIDYFFNKKVVNEMQNYSDKSLYFNLFYELIKSSIEDIIL